MVVSLEEADGQRRQSMGWSLRWNGERACRWKAEGWWRDAPLGVYAVQLAAAEPDRLMIVDGQHRLTASDLYTSALALAQSFVGRGLKPGSVVSFMLPNWHEACVIYLATALAGLVAHPLIPAFREAELAFMLADCNSRILFIPEQFRGTSYPEMAVRAVQDFASPPELMIVRGMAGNHTAYENLLHGNAAQQMPDVDADHVRMLIYTSGTTGRPKGVLHTHNTLAATTAQLHRYWGAGEGDAFFIPSPISHIGGSLYAFEFPILFGTVAVLQEQWDPEAATDLIMAERCTHMAGATPFLQQLMAAAKARGTILPSLRVFICGGASVPPDLIRAAAAYFPHCLVTRVYGLTEVPTITIGTVDRADIEHAAETDGKAGLADVKLVSALGANEGEVAACGPQMLVGYLHAEDEAGAFDEEGYFLTGDIAQLVDGEFYRISGRRKDIIIRQGENISPKEVEDLLVTHPDIEDVAVVGLPSAKTGEVACAVIVPAVGKNPTVADIFAFLEGHRLAKFKIPEQVVLRPALPRNATGKVLKVQLRAELLQEQAGA